jgi:hypothetical protein
MPFVRLFPFDIVKPQSGGATFYSRTFFLASSRERWPSRLVATATTIRLN